MFEKNSTIGVPKARAEHNVLEVKQPIEDIVPEREETPVKPKSQAKNKSTKKEVK